MNMRRNLFMHLVVPIVAGRWQGIANEMENKKMGGGGGISSMHGQFLCPAQPGRGRNNKPEVKLNSFSFLLRLVRSISPEGNYADFSFWGASSYVSFSIFYCPILVLPNFLFFVYFYFEFDRPLTTDGRPSKRPGTRHWAGLFPSFF
jgi:hypothetical protein